MTIKDIEQVLNVPRATIRFYEKEGLINPERAENGYRDYSDQDVESLKKIIILRKIGLSVNDIEDLLDGAKSMDTVLDVNMHNLQKQMEELTGAMNLCQKMKNDTADINSFDTEVYWNYVDEEEKKGNSFMDIAKDIAHEERKIFAKYLGWNTDSDGKSYDIVKDIKNTIVLIALMGVMHCVLNKDLSVKSLLWGLKWILIMIVFESIIAVPLYFLGKRFEWVARNRARILYAIPFVLCLILVIIAAVINM